MTEHMLAVNKRVRNLNFAKQQVTEEFTTEIDYATL